MTYYFGLPTCASRQPIHVVNFHYTRYAVCSTEVKYSNGQAFMRFFGGSNRPNPLDTPVLSLSFYQLFRFNFFKKLTFLRPGLVADAM